MRTRARLRTSLGLLVALLAPAAIGQTIFRCGESYSQSPCANARVIEPVEAPTAAQRGEARAVAARAKLLALEMVRDRQERERAIRPATAGSLGPSRAPQAAAAPAASKKRGQAKKLSGDEQDRRDFVASVPRAKK